MKQLFPLAMITLFSTQLFGAGVDRSFLNDLIHQKDYVLVAQGHKNFNDCEPRLELNTFRSTNNHLYLNVTQGMNINLSAAIDGPQKHYDLNVGSPANSSRKEETSITGTEIRAVNREISKDTLVDYNILQRQWRKLPGQRRTNVENVQTLLLRKTADGFILVSIYENKIENVTETDSCRYKKI